MAKTPLPEIELIRQIISYDPMTGALTWLDRPAHLYRDTVRSTAAEKAAFFNARHSGQPAFKSRHSAGYYFGGIFRLKIYAHRVAFALYYGRWPNGDIDHINGDGLDNRISNLRDVPHAINQKNQRLKSRSSILPVGVSYVRTGKRLKRYHAHATVDRKKLSLGYYRTVEEARNARQEFSLNNGFTKRHGQK